MSERYSPKIRAESASEIRGSVSEQTRDNLNALTEGIFKDKKLTVKTREKGKKGNLIVRQEKNGLYEYKYILTPGESVTATGRYRISKDSPDKDADHLWLEVTFHEGKKIRKGWVSSKYLVGELTSIRDILPKKEDPKKEEMKSEKPPTPADTVIELGGDYGLPLLPADKYIRKNGKLYDLSIANIYNYKKGDILSGKHFEQEKNAGLLYDDQQGKIMILDAGTEVHERSEIVALFGEPKQLNDKLIYTGADGVRRNMNIWNTDQCYEITAEIRQDIFQIIQKKPKESIRFLKETNGKEWIVFDLKPGQEIKEVNKETLRTFDATDIKNWKDGDQIKFYSPNNFKTYWKYQDVEIWEDGFLTTNGKVPASELLVIEEKVGEKKIKKMCIKPKEMSMLGSAKIFEGIKNSEEIAKIIMNDNIEKEWDYSDTTQDIYNKVKEIQRTSQSKNDTIKKIYEYIKKRVKYSERVGDYYRELDKFYQKEITQKPTRVSPTTEDGSGLFTLNTGSGVCEGYADSLILMLSFAGIDDVHYISGYAPTSTMLNNKPASGWTAEQKKEMSHGWVKIGDKHYDITWDDVLTADGSRNTWFGLTDTQMKARGREWK